MHEEVDIDLSDEENSDQSLTLDKEINDYRTGYQIPISEEVADKLYYTAGFLHSEQNNDIVVLPSPHILISLEEDMIKRAKAYLSIEHDNDGFQLQSVISLLNGENVILIALCGVGKSTVVDMALYLRRIQLNKPKGVAICLQPLNSILHI